MYRTDSGKPSTGGTAILIRHGIPHFKAQAFLSPENEATFINVGTSASFVTLCSLYSRQIITSQFEFFLNQHNKVVIAGDFNAHHVAWNCRNSSAKGEALLNICTRHNVQISAPLDPTRENAVLDFVLSKNVAILEVPITITEYCSDHFPVLFTIPLRAALPGQPVATVPNFLKADWLEFKLFIHRRLDSNLKIDTMEQLEKAVIDFTEITSSAIDKTIPKFKPQSLKIPLNVKDLIEIRNKLRKCHYKIPGRIPKCVINHLNKIIHYVFKDLRNKYFEDRLSKLKENSPDIFNEIRKLRGGKANPISIIKTDNHPIIDPQEIAEKIAERYEAVHAQNDLIGNLNFTEQVRSSISSFLSTGHDSVTIPHTDVSEVTSIVRSFRNKKSPGDDNIPNVVIKHLPERALTILVVIINSILTLGYFPNFWKLSKVIPIPKPGKPPDDINNTRPISLLSGLSKIVEIVILNRLNAYIENLLPDEQFGFRHKKSTTQALLRLVNYIKKSKNHGRSTMSVFLDIEKAFDTVWHDGLIYKMIEAKFPYYLIKVVNSYLNGRKFYVCHNGSKSSIKDVVAGVPQGSVLGPSLYSFYTHDIPKSPETQLQMYADDTTVFTASTSERASCVRLQNHLDDLSEYFSKWKIKINSGKTEFIQFFKNNFTKLPPAIPISLEGHTLIPQDNVKYLGVVLNRKLNYNSHIQHLKKKASTAFSSLYPLLFSKSGLSIPNKLAIYKLYIRPIITYAAPVMVGSLSKTSRNGLQLIQNKVIRVVYNDWPIPPTNKCISNSILLEMSGLETVEQFSRKLQYNFINHS